MVAQAHDFLGPRAVTAAVRGRGQPFKVVRNQSNQPSRSSLPPGVAFVLCPPTVPKDDCVTINEAVYREWLKGRGAAWDVGCPEVRYCRTHESFQICTDPNVAASAALITESGLAAALDTLEGAALDECVSKHLVEGGDDRLHLNADGVNKYFSPPRPLDSDVVIRGSCTCSAPTIEGYEAARKMLRAIWVGDTTFDDGMQSVARRLSKVLRIKVPHEVILHPSGSDAELIPLAVAQARAERLGCAAVVNIVVAAGEVGSGTAPASGGRHFNDFAPNGKVICSTLVDGFAVNTEVVELKPRNADGSRNDDYDALVRRACDQAHSRLGDPFILLHAVDGSKTGMRVPSKELITELVARHGARILICMDACQARSEPEEIDWFMRRGACVLVTSSKFYSAPGFCGAVLLPRDAAADLEEWPNVPPGLADYLTKYEVSRRMPLLRSKLPGFNENLGLLLRWAAGLREMELFADQGPAVTSAMRRWVKGVRNLVRQRGPLLELIDQRYENVDDDRTRLGGLNTVVSIKFLSACGSKHLDADVLRKVHKLLTIDASSHLPSWASQEDRDAASLRCMVGQPVKLGDYGVLRLAVGAPMARRMACAGVEAELEHDRRILDKMEVLAAHCDAITV